MQADDKETDNQPIQHKMMMTSLVVVTGPSGDRMTVGAMLDSGAESSVMSKKVMDSLKLRPVEWVNLSGTESPKQTPARPKVKIAVSAVNGDWVKNVTTVRGSNCPGTSGTLPEFQSKNLSRTETLISLLLSRKFCLAHE